MKQILLLHGAIGAQDQLKPLCESLRENYNVHTLDFGGHGDSKRTAEVFSIGAFANDVLHYLETEKIEKINVFGYSMGGYVALYLAKHHPEKIESIVTFATKFLWTPEIAEREIKMLDPEKIAEKIPAFAQQLEKRHHKHDWRNVLQKTAAMMVKMGESNPVTDADLKAIAQRVLIGVGDNDMMVSLEETISAYRQLQHSELVVFPGTQHPIEKVDLNKITMAVDSFLS